MKVFFLLFMFYLIPLRPSAQVLYSEKDVGTFNSIISEASKLSLSDSAIGNIIVHIGRQFLEKPYVGGVLDKPESESLVIDLNGLDCVTYLESTVALSIIIKEHKTQFDDFCNELKYLRYRDGVMKGYASRLHYFYEWIENNQQKGVLENITEVIGGRQLIKKINFISVNREKYPRIIDDSTFVALRKAEEQLSAMNKFYVPKVEIRQCEHNILDGDLIAITTTVEGLDIAHVGIAVHVNNVLHLMHASSLNKQVEISELPLYEMLQNKASWSGIIVSRLKN